MNRLIRRAMLALVATSACAAWAQGNPDGSKPVQVAAAAAQEKYELHELGAGGVMLDPKVKSAYYKALGRLSKEPWLAKLDGPSPQNKRIEVAGADYVLISACKNHDCAENNTVLLYSRSQDVVYGKVYQQGKSTLIGSPPLAVATELERLWKMEWRQGH